MSKYLNLSKITKSARPGIIYQPIVFKKHGQFLNMHIMNAPAVFFMTSSSIKTICQNQVIGILKLRKSSIAIIGFFQKKTDLKCFICVTLGF